MILKIKCPRDLDIEWFGSLVGDSLRNRYHCEIVCEPYIYVKLAGNCQYPDFLRGSRIVRENVMKNVGTLYKFMIRHRPSVLRRHDSPSFIMFPPPCLEQINTVGVVKNSHVVYDDSKLKTFLHTEVGKQAIWKFVDLL